MDCGETVGLPHCALSCGCNLAIFNATSHCGLPSHLRFAARESLIDRAPVPVRLTHLAWLLKANHTHSIHSTYMCICVCVCMCVCVHIKTNEADRRQASRASHQSTKWPTGPTTFQNPDRDGNREKGERKRERWRERRREIAGEPWPSLSFSITVSTTYTTVWALC